MGSICGIDTTIGMSVVILFRTAVSFSKKKDPGAARLKSNSYGIRNMIVPRGKSKI